MLKKMSSELVNRLLVRSLFDFCKITLNCPQLQQFSLQNLKRSSRSNPVSLPQANILHVTDIHLDLGFKQGSSSQCDFMICCRDGTGQNRIAHLNCDVSLPFLQQAVDSMQKLKPDIVIITGDLAAHNQWQKGQELLKETHKLVVHQFNKLKAETVFILGNNDLEFDHQYSVDRDLQLRKSFAQLVNITEPFFFKCGFYSKTVKNIKFIALNLQPADLNNFHSIRKFENQCRQISWLFAQLEQAVSSSTPVFLLSHLPLTDYNSYKVYVQKLMKVVNQFSDVIKGQFYGHSHSDYFKVHSSGSLSFVSPALSPFKTGQSFYRIYELSQNKISNYKQFKLTLPNQYYVLDYQFITRFNSTDSQLLRDVIVRALHDQRIAALFEMGPIKQTDGKFKSSCKLLSTSSQIEECLGQDLWHQVLHLIKLHN